MDKYSKLFKKYSDDYLLQTRNQNKVYYKFLFGFVWVALISGVLFIIFDVATSDESMFGILLGLGLLEIAVGVMCWFLGKECKRKVHAANIELAKRGLESYVEQDYQQTAKRFKKAIIVGLVILVSVMTIWVISEVSNNSNGGRDSSVRCPNCGMEYREGHAAANYIEEYGYCSYCDGKKWG